MAAQINYDSVQTGQQLPGLDIPITASLIVAGAIATCDFSLVHHDKANAQAAGTPDIFMNILTSNGLVQRFVNDWAGPAARIKGVRIRLGAPNFPGDTMKMSGSVKSKEVVGKDKLVEVAVSGVNSLGEHVSGTVRLTLP
ncbi:MAG: acyl dehydratase [Gammaproteobacteria bacterium]|nr:acyl dehydratase [Gammaproteobacteria bacterium]